MPPTPSSLVEEGSEFWGRYPEFYQKGFKGEAVPSELHRRMLKQRYFPIVGSVPKCFVGRNRRGVDISVAQFENETGKTVDRTSWGLPVPNREAAYLSLAKYAKDVPALGPDQVVAMNTAVDWLTRHFGVHMQGSRVKSVEEVVNGLDMTTSPGYPWTRKYASKRAMYDNWKEFPKYMEDDWEWLKSNDYVAVFGNSLKEEIRPAEKIEANSIRTFTAGPVEMTVHGNRLFEDMNEKFYASHLQTASVVGFSPWKGGWNELFLKLQKHRNGFALDESQYDSSLRAYLMWAVAEFRWWMLRDEDRTPENKVRLQVYYRNLINTLIVTSDGVFVLKQGGNPSGSVNTIVDNTLILFILLAYGWIMLSPRSMRSYEAFEAELALALCGDDNTWTVSDEAVKFFNARTLIKEWDRIGVITTTDCLDPRPLEELDFLSAFTVFVDGVAVPLYNRSKLLTSLLYSRSPGDPSYTLVRAAALLRVGWADVQLRGYLRELISWLVATYGLVLRESPEWKAALSQVPTELELRKFYLGLEGVEFPMSSQGQNRSPGIKSEETSVMQGQVALPQRVRGRRQPRKARRARRRAGPLLPNGMFSARGRGMALVPKRGRRRRNRRGRGLGVGGRTTYGGETIERQSLGRASGRALQGGVGVRKTDRIVEREFLATIAGSTGYSVGNTFALNPGLVASFPWLSIEAAGWESYRFNKLRFCYYTRKGSSTDGSVIMGPDYDPNDGAPADEATFTTYQDVKEFAPWMDNVCVDLDAQQLNKIGRAKFVRTGTLPTGAQIVDYDSGNFFVATTGMADASNVGKLWVEYDVTFETKQKQQTAVAPTNNRTSWFQSAAEQTYTSTVAAQAVVATATANGLSIVNTAGSMVPPAGNYLVYFTTAGSDTSAENFTVLSDFQKNAVSVYADNETKPKQGAILDTAGGFMTATGSVFVSANGTDAFILKNTLVGAAGTLTAGSSVLWVAI